MTPKLEENDVFFFAEDNGQYFVVEFACKMYLEFEIDSINNMSE